MTIPFLDLHAMHEEISDELDLAWSQARASCGFVGGLAVSRFEAEWADYCGTRHCVGVGSGTAALELTLRGLGIGPGDEVLVPANSFIATANAVVAVGARPVFADVDPGTLLLTPADLRQAITPRTAAVMVVHLYGQPADMDAINGIAMTAGIAVIEDAAQAHGATWRGCRAGGLSAAGCFSFYPGKNLGAFGDAGAVVTNDWSLAERVRALSNHGRRSGDPYCHEIVGANHRMDAIQAAVLSAKLARLEGWNAGRRRAAARYADALSGLPVRLVKQADGACSSHHLAVIRTPRRALLRRALDEQGIMTAVHYPIACHLQAPFAGQGTPPLPATERAAQEVLSLPMFPHLTDAQIRRVADAVGCALTEREAALPEDVGA